MARFVPHTAALAGAFLGALMFAGGVTVTIAPPSEASVCGSVGGARIDITGCADPFSYLNQALTPPPPDLTPNMTACVNVGRRISVSGCR